MADEDEVEDQDLEVEAEGAADDVALAPNEAADPPAIVDRKVPQDIRDKYEIISYRNAAVILAETRQHQFNEIIEALRGFRITTEMIRRAGGNESEMPKVFSKALRPLGWHETVIQADLSVTLSWREEVRKTRAGKSVMGTSSPNSMRTRSNVGVTSCAGSAFSSISDAEADTTS
jgi:Restriction endonuclease BglII